MMLCIALVIIIMSFVYVQVRLVDSTKCKSYWVSLHDIKGIQALEIEIPTNDEVVLPPQIKFPSLLAIINFNRKVYKLPEDFLPLVSQLITADTLGADHFVEYISQNLCVPASRLNTSNEYSAIKKLVRDRYRLSMKVTLEFPPAQICYKCKNAFKDLDIQNNVTCCGMTFHRKCLKNLKKCPYCCEPWVELECCVCGGTSTPPAAEYLHDTHKERSKNRMSCCSVEVHTVCKNSLARCPACFTALKNGYPSQPKTAKDFCQRRYILRKVQATRRELG